MIKSLAVDTKKNGPRSCSTDQDRLVFVQESWEDNFYRRVSHRLGWPANAMFFFTTEFVEKQFFTLPVVNNNEIERSTSNGVEGKSGLRQDPPWFEFLVILDFFAPWYRRGREASSVKILLKNSKEKLVKCATEVARSHRVSIQSCTQNRPSPKVQSLSRDWI